MEKINLIRNFEKISFKELKNGVNSNVYKVSKDKKHLILKIYILSLKNLIQQ